MKRVLTTAATVQCSHQGGVVLGPGASKLTIRGQPVLLDTDLLGNVDAACTNRPPPTGRVPCTLVVQLTAGAARKLTVRGRPVQLEDTNGSTNSVPVPGTLVVSEPQNKLTTT